MFRTENRHGSIVIEWDNELTTRMVCVAHDSKNLLLAGNKEIEHQSLSDGQANSRKYELDDVCSPTGIVRKPFVPTSGNPPTGASGILS